jgi:tetratricopeptide (TPR) repeat protein
MAEEFAGKYRLDFCLGSSLSIANAIGRAASSKGLCADVATKAYQKSKWTLEESRACFGKALEYVKLADSKPSDAILDVQIKEVESLVSASNYLDAIKLIDRVFSSSDLPVHHKSNLYRIIGDCFTKLGDLVSGKEAYETSLSLDPYLASAVIGLGVIAINQNKSDMAIIQFQKAVTYAPQDDMACLGLGLAFQGIGEIPEANKWMERCLDLNPLNAAGLFSMLKIAHQVKDFKYAIPALEKYLKLKPTDLSVQYSYAGALFAMQDYIKSLDVVKGILDQDPSHAQAMELKTNLDQKMNSALSKVGSHA